MKKLIIAMVVSLGVGFVHADEIKADFDGKKGMGVSFMDLLKTADSCQNDKIECAAPAPEKVEPAVIVVYNNEVKIKVSMKNGSVEKNETVVCRAGADAKTLEGCKKQSDFSPLTRDDTNIMMLRKYFPVETPMFSDLLNQTKHSYTGHSGPQTFQCDDSCQTVCKPVKKTIKTVCGISNGLPIYCLEVIIESVCKEECTHSCECIAGCYN